ncbi:MAG: hypothetical protein A2339_00735 [Elusimicrobia bacterium RIFOXYB12_FULL_50_12]|nr:MAG: hypothetical protein A2278_05340 [Elusimicrobia bacterium RIFOXYA12_FULL_49_49]OGS11403.1 MAG: hypothetical protein A2386_06390 [Elusimicrobia bacterium RIFOXYB1_FULL_48_9]OGS16498.1 MAG: hypothetical protein A2251_06720 [Elusimicrobia bacterium RIFOXYA2_FULL_47_53]OGS25893.1 MAG: hypothetical protein A2339_00735 [Elusimicrobia bacterium RIFOXYB12_FULL_50_12]OGS31235.1 MAG: hypothetical protein A2323_01005 [Elusimicrobia bacterium RIFOXYB2_FULL_46_23]
MKFRKNTRLKSYDYSSDGFYFVTVCTYCRKPYLEKVAVKEVAELAQLGNLPGVHVDYFVVMPTHIHFILRLDSSKYTLFQIVRGFKSKTTVFVNKTAEQARRLHRLWQPNYYEHVIRSEKALLNIRRYIENNLETEKLNWKTLD